MKSSIFLVACMCMMLQGALAENERQIKVNIDEWRNVNRSLSSAPVLTHDGNTVFMYSLLPLQDMEVTVTDASGCVVYSGILSVGADQTVSFTFDSMENTEGAYLIEITHGRKYLSGWFEIE